MQKNSETERQIDVLLSCDEDVILARQKIRAVAQDIGFGMLDQTRIVTAASELARNIVVHAKTGKVMVERLTAPREGIRVVFADKGPGIPDLNKAMQDGFSTVNTMGLGLKGAKRLMDEFNIETAPGAGTTVTVVKWLRND